MKITELDLNIVKKPSSAIFLQPNTLTCLKMSLIAIIPSSLKAYKPKTFLNCVIQLILFAYGPSYTDFEPELSSDSLHTSKPPSEASNPYPSLHQPTSKFHQNLKPQTYS